MTTQGCHRYQTKLCHLGSDRNVGTILQQQHGSRWAGNTGGKFETKNFDFAAKAICWLISMFSRLLHTSEHIAFNFVLEQVVWMGSMLIADYIWRIFMLLTNQIIRYSQANQKRCFTYLRGPQLTYIIDLKSRSDYRLYIRPCLDGGVN